MLSTKNRKILLISPIPTHPTNFGNRIRILNLLNAIRSMGLDYYLLFIPFVKGDLAAMKEHWGERFLTVNYDRPDLFIEKINRRTRKIFKRDILTSKNIDRWYSPKLNNYIKQLDSDYHFNIVMVEYVFLSKAFVNFSGGTLKILDTIDRFSDRSEQMRKQGLSPTWFSTTQKDERKGLKRADVIISISDEEKFYFRNLLHSDNVVTISHLFQTYPPKKDRLERTKSDILYLGSWNSSNIQAITYFINTIYPLVTNQKPNTRLIIAGSVCSMIQVAENILCSGEVEDLNQLYDSVDVVINPCKFGTGISIKTLEALGHSKPVVTTSEGARGIDQGKNEAYLVSDTPEEFAGNIIRILSDPDYAYDLSIRAFKFSEKWNKNNNNKLSALFKKN